MFVLRGVRIRVPHNSPQSTKYAIYLTYLTLPNPSFESFQRIQPPTDLHQENSKEAKTSIAEPSPSVQKPPRTTRSNGRPKRTKINTLKCLSLRRNAAIPLRYRSRIPMWPHRNTRKYPTGVNTSGGAGFESEMFLLLEVRGRSFLAFYRSLIRRLGPFHLELEFFFLHRLKGQSKTRILTRIH